MLRAALASVILAGCCASALTASPAVGCTGDCNKDGRVSVDELLAAINVLHGDLPLPQCQSLDRNNDGGASADALLAAVHDALFGCEPTPSGCGNGVTEGQEECDDGNHTDGDGCSTRCTLEPDGDVCTGIPTHNGTQLHTVLVTDGVSTPLYVTAPRRDVSRIFIVEQTGHVRIVKWGVLLPNPFLDVSARISCCGERGLLSLAFHPAYADNGTFFVDYTDRQGDTVVSRWQVSGDPDIADGSSETVILRQKQPFANHNGGLVVFGPDGRLYVGLGDGGSGGDPRNNGQHLDTWLGKLLRIDIDGAPETPYTVPADNPFVGTPGALPEIWDFGLRNPWRFSFDRGTGELYIADVGQDMYEEVDVEPAGSGAANYGWRLMEGLHCFNPPTDCPMQGLVLPVLEYDHSQEACSITGGYVYRGCALPDLRGTYFYADYCSNFIRSFAFAGGVATDQRDRTADLAPGGGHSIAQISSFGEDARGELYICDLRGAVYKILPAN